MNRYAEIPQQATGQGAESLQPVELVQPVEPVQPTQPLDSVEPAAAITPAAPAPYVPSHVLDVSCPGCGTITRVDAGQRSSTDFCPQCDYPLFWAVERVNLSLESGTDSLRRLPGTIGRATLASVACPTCTEPNSPHAHLCVRCGSELFPVPVVVVEPEPEPIVEPEPIIAGPPWWLWPAGVAAALVVAAVALSIIVLV